MWSLLSFESSNCSRWYLSWMLLVVYAPESWNEPLRELEKPLEL
jgi:hypothetical protein